MSYNNAKQPGYQAPAVNKTFRILKTISESGRNLGLSELAHRLGFSKSTTHGLVHALIREGALGQTPKGRKLYLGATIFDLTLGSWNYFKITKNFQPKLNMLRDQIGETVFLGGLSRSRVLIMATAEAAKPLNISASPGTSIPLFAGAVGKVFFAEKEIEYARAIIREYGLPCFTPRSIVDENRYIAELSWVRKHGYALDNEEYIPGVKAVAVGLKNQSGLPMAIWVVGFAGTMGNKEIPNIIKNTTDTGRKLRSMLENDR